MLDIRDHGGILGGLGSSSIKSIQRISINYSNSTRLDVSISAVDLTKSIVIMEFASYLENINFQPCVELLTSTTVRLSSNASSSTGQTIYLYVIEFTNVKSKQNGSYTASGSSPANPYNVSISTVNPSKCLAFASNSSSLGRASMNYIVATVETANKLRINFDAGPGPTGTIKWQVLEFK